MSEEEINEAIANGKYIANIYGEGSIGYYKVYSMIDVIDKLQKEREDIKEYINSPEFLDWHLGYKIIDELEYRKNRINEMLKGE